MMLLPTFIVAFVGLTSAFVMPRGGISDEVRMKRQSAPYPANMIDMPIDHFPTNTKYAPHEKGTFKQRYFFDSTYYKPGGPVYLYIGGETSGTNRFSNLKTGIIQILMEATNGLGVILENRFYGQSYPFNTSTTDQLRYNSNEQTIADNAYFAQHATFPGVKGNLTAPGTPWILYGGSLAGAETAFSIIDHGDVLYGGIAASAPVKTVLEYPQWYNPVQKYGPSDCITSVNDLVARMNGLVALNDSKAITELKTIFGLESLLDIRDFAATIGFPLGGPFNYPIGTWQELNWNPASSDNSFFNFCSALTNTSSSLSVKAVDMALSKYTNNTAWTNLGNYADYIKQVYLPLCTTGDYNSMLDGCFGTQNETWWKDVSNSATRSYIYTTCVELGAYQVAPKSGPALIMNVLQVDYTQQWCTWAFPPGAHHSIPLTPRLSTWNSYGGFSISAPRLAFIDGDIDVWVDLCYHSHLAPSPRTGPEQYLIAGAGHHWDSAGIKNVSAEPLFIKAAHEWEIRTVKKWLGEFGTWKSGGRVRREL